MADKRNYDNEFEEYNSELYDEWAAGVSDPNLADGTNRADLRDENIKRSQKPEEVFRSVVQFKAFSDNVIILNDLFFYDVPISSIQFKTPSDVGIFETLRSPSPIVTSQGKRDIIINISLAFPPGEAQTKKLRRLMAEITQHPFVFVHNNTIKQKLNVDEFETTIFAVEAGSIRSTRDTVGLIMLDLQLHYFNYKPFSKHFYYNTRMPGFSTQRDNLKTSTKDVETLNLDELSGYESSDYTISRIANNTVNKLKEEAKNLYELTKQSVPVNLPAASDAWMYFANNLESKRDFIKNDVSDYIGFSIREYTYLSPQDSQLSESPATIGELLKYKHKPIEDAYSLQKALQEDAKSKSQARENQTVQEKELEDLTKEDISFDRTSLVKFRNHLGKTAKFPLSDIHGNVPDDTIYELSKFADKRQKAKKEGVFYSEKLIRLFLQIAAHYPGRTIHLISGIRDPGWVKKRLPKDPSPGKVRRHPDGLAMDLRVEGVPNKDLFEWCRDNLNNSGKGYYPNSKFVHIDTREGNVYWQDNSFPGEKSNYVYMKSSGQINSGEIQAEAEDDKDEINSVKTDKQVQQQHVAEYRGNVHELTEQQRREREEYASGKKDATSKKEANSSKNRKEARNKWITKQAQLGWYYYYDDPKVRNVFYKDTQVNISSDPGIQLAGSALKDIVCSSISVTFGHRLAPMRLVSNQYYSYQFLGAGNKAGQIVLTFAGKEGRRSAAIIKELITKALENSRVFGSIVKEAGAITLIRDFLKTNEQNTILALADIKDIVVVDISELNVEDGADKHQMVIEFVAQDFAQEKLDVRFQTPLAAKKKIISSILRNIKSKELKFLDTNEIYVDTNLVKENLNGNGDAYTLVKDTPQWIGELLVEAARLCRETDKEMPPIDWKVGPNESKTWRDHYNKWGAGNIFIGKVNNIDSSDKFTSNPDLYNAYSEYNSTVALEYKKALEEQKKGGYYNNGGAATNGTHGDLFRDWVTKMDVLVNVVKRHLSDEETIERFFPGILDDVIDTAIADLGSCYDDMNLPNVPGTNIKLPPEFYIYDDSHEDPLVSNMTDDQNMEKELQRHVNNEFESIKHYLEDSLLGGSYFSKNMPKIRQQRISEHRRSRDENLYNRYVNYFKDGARAWEPIYTRKDDMDDKLSGTKEWIEKVGKHYESPNSDIELPNKGEKFNYLTNIIKLSPYIKDGRHWDEGLSSTDYESLIEAQYANAEKALAFGPNPQFQNVDSMLTGKALNPEDEKLGEAITNKDLANLSEKELERKQNIAKGISSTKDQAITFGSTDEEIQSAKTQGWLSELGETVLEGVKPVLTAAKPLLAFLPGGIKELAFGLTQLGEIQKAIEAVKAVALDASVEKYEHFFSKEQIDEKKRIAQTATKVALGKKRNDLSMRRAYPTFKIYFIEDDSTEDEVADGKLRRAFDDFYSYSAIQEIKIYMNREIAAHTAVIRMTNVGGLLLRKRFGETDIGDSKYNINGERQGIFADTEKEHPFEKMILQDGVKVQIRLGYHADPNKLKSVFLGQVVEMGLAEQGKIIEIVCQGFGAELESVELGPLENGPVFYSTQQALSAAIIQDSIANFGRQDRFNLFNPAEARHAWTGGVGTGILAGLTPSNMLKKWSEKKLEKLFNRYQFKNFPQDDNIYAPPPQVFSSAWSSFNWTTFWNNACIYRPLKQTPWEIFKEHELRHPGYITMAVPYGHEPRMTMFFGSKMQHYWSRPPSALEVELSRGAKNDIIKARQHGFDLLQKGAVDELIKFAERSPKLGAAFFNDIFTTGSRYDTGFALGELFGRYIPFRGYHYIDSTHHILKNEIRTSSDGTFNEVEIFYTEDEGNITDNDAEDIVEHVEEVSMGGAGVLAVKLDENIPESSIRSLKGEFPSCVTVDMAKRYAQGLFARTLRDAYKGEICIIGDENIKPYDIVFINDTSINMTGPIEVEEVTHIFNRDYGFMTIITPDLCVEVNDYYTASVFDITASAMSYSWGVDTAIDLGNTALGVFAPPVAAGISALKGLSFLAISAGVKFMQWTQEGAPVMATPLTLGGKPMLSNALAANHTSMYLSYAGKWNQYWDDLGDAWNRFDLAESIFESRINFQQGFYELFGADATGASGGQ